MLLSFYHTCASKQHDDLHDRVSLILSLSYTSGNFRYRTWLVYSNNGIPQMPQASVSKQVGCTPTQFRLLSFHTFIALVHPSSSFVFILDSHLFCHSHLLVVIFVIELGLYIPRMGFLKIPQVFVSKQVGCTPTQFIFVELSYIYSSSASVAWQSLLTHIGIY